MGGSDDLPHQGGPTVRLQRTWKLTAIQTAAFAPGGIALRDVAIPRAAGRFRYQEWIGETNAMSALKALVFKPCHWQPANAAGVES